MEVGKPVKVFAARIQTNVVPTLASTRLMRRNRIQPFIECAEFRHPDRGFLLGGNIFVQAYGVQGRDSRQFLTDNVDEAPIDRHLGSMWLIVNVLDIAAEPAFLFQVIAKLLQKLPEILFCTWIVCRQILPYNLTIFDQVCRDYIRRVISTAEPSAQVAALDHARHTGFVEDLNPMVD